MGASELTGKVVAITGASRGIGRAVARSLAGRGASVALLARDGGRLAEAVDEARREVERLRAFLAADLARYRAALPGTESGYLARLEEALAAGCPPCGEDVAALRALCARPARRAEARRRAELLRRCEEWADPVEAYGSRDRVPTPADVFPPRHRSTPPSRRALPV